MSASPGDPQVYRIESEQERFWLAGEAARLGARAGLAPRRQQALGIVVAELVSNAAKHAGGGLLRLWVAAAPGGRRGVSVSVEDHGPGIASLDDARRDGFSQGRMLTPETPASERRGLGVGLGAVERLADEVTFVARPGGGTQVTATLWAQPGEHQTGEKRGEGHG